MRNPVPRLVALAAGVWILRAVGPEWHGAWALGTNLLAAVGIQAGLWLNPAGLVAWALLAGIFWDFTTFSPLGHHLLETRAWEWPFLLNVSIVLGGLVNGAASVVMGWWLEQEDRFPVTSRARRRIR